jgi:hypothetical protein
MLMFVSFRLGFCFDASVVGYRGWRLLRAGQDRPSAAQHAVGLI